MAKWQGTPVSNTGYVENVYFNTNLSVDEVVSILDTISYNEEIGMEVILGSELDENDNSKIIFISKTNNVWVIMVNFGDTLQEILFVASDDLDLGFVGWYPDITYPLAINFNAVNELDGIAFGSQNNLLSSLFSTTPFVEVQEKVTLNGFLKNIADAIRSKKGTTDKINASNFASEIESIESGGGGDRLKTLLDTTKSCYYLFKGYGGNNFNELIKYNDTENVNEFGSMFYDCTATSFPQLDTSNGTSFKAMFYNCKNATSFPQLDTSKGVDLQTMFYNCSSATSFPQLDTSNCTIVFAMFSGCTNATSFPQLDTSKVTGTGIKNLFNKCSSATSFPQLDTSNCNDFSNMFSHCYKAVKIDVSHYNMPYSSSSYEWCYNCYSLKAIIIRSFGTKYPLNNNSLNYCYHILGTTNSTYNPNGDKDGYIYVPRDMIETLSSATNWSKVATQFRALEDYTKDGTTTGEFDDEKAGLV